MIKLENFEVVGWEHVIRGMRNPLNSWGKSDSKYCHGASSLCNTCYKKPDDDYAPCYCASSSIGKTYVIGPNDHSLMMKLRNSGTDHRKFMRMITVYVDITAPLYWWKEFDTYKVGTVANSCSTMHKIHAKEFTLDDFSHEHLCDYATDDFMVINADEWNGHAVLDITIRMLNFYRDKYFETKRKPMKDEKARQKNMKFYWWQMIQLLPSSYNQKRTVMLNYEVLANIYKSRKDHKLDEWHVLCDWIKTLPYSELIIGPSLEDVPICNEIMAEAEKRSKND